MRKSGAYGERFGDALRITRAPFLLTRTLRQTDIAVTEVRADDPTEEMSGSIPGEDAFLVALQLRDFPQHEYWEDGRRAPVASLSAGCTTVYDLKRDPLFLINNPFHSIHVYLPRATLDAVAEEAGTRRIDDLRYEPGAGTDDPIMRGLAMSLKPALERTKEANRLFASAVLVAIVAHVA